MNAILELVSAAKYGLATPDICARLNKTAQELGDDFEQLREADQVHGYAGIWFTPENFATATQVFIEALDELHAEAPDTESHLPSIVCERRQLPWSGKSLDRIVSALVAQGSVIGDSTGIRSATFRVKLSRRQQELLDRVRGVLDVAGVEMPAGKEIANQLGIPYQAIEEILRLGVQTRDVVPLGQGMYLSRTTLTNLGVQGRAALGVAPFTTSQFRQSLNLPRRIVVPVLQQLEIEGFVASEDGVRRMTAG